MKHMSVFLDPDIPLEGEHILIQRDWASVHRRSSTEVKSKLLSSSKTLQRQSKSTRPSRKSALDAQEGMVVPVSNS